MIAKLLRAIALVLVVVAAFTACGLLNPKTAIDTGNAIACIENAARHRQSVGEIALACGVDVADVIADILLSKDPEVSKTPAYGEARRARARMQALPPDPGPQTWLLEDQERLVAIGAIAPPLIAQLGGLRACTIDERELARALEEAP